MRVHLDQLEALLWISRLGSFRAAARRLNISQPAVSGRIRELERQLDVVVIDRSQRRPQITPRGTEIVRCAEQMMGLSDRLLASLKSDDALVGRIRIGAADSFALKYLPGLLTQIAVHHPAAQVELDIDFSANLDRKLRAAELDVAFLHGATATPQIAVESLMDVALDWFASPRMRLPGGRLTARDVVRVPILTNPRPSHLYQTIVDWFAADGLAPQRLNTCTSLSVIVKLTAAGFGISVLPPMLVGSELRSGTLRKLRTTPRLPTGDLAVAYRIDPRLGNLGGIGDLVRRVMRKGT